MAFPEFDHLFSNTPVFIPSSDLEAMERIVQAIESAVKLPSYRERVLSWAPEIAHFNPGPVGAFMGYDFHLSPDGPRLIEINTNAGGGVSERCAGESPAPMLWPVSTNRSDPSSARRIRGYSVHNV